MIMRFHQLFSYVSFLAVIGTGCSTSHPASRDSSHTHYLDANGHIITTNVAPDAMSQYRNKLSDLYTVFQNTVPDAFKPVVSRDTAINRSYGYRIQILSSENKSTAEDALHEYNDWIFQQKNIPYKADGYIVFKQPYYRVHIGDFINRDNAIKFAKELKRRFPDAWLVHDRINYSQTPDQILKHVQMENASMDSTQVDSLKHN